MKCRGELQLSAGIDRLQIGCTVPELEAFEENYFTDNVLVLG